ncbi:MAG: accessory gene regulator B family protein [Lachnospiraceae bacterium]|nr:accessory gene regulator B family protein [Lachnospiraceae bacterium]
MKRLSEKLTGYVINTGTISAESYAVYQYGFQIGLEMLCCFVVCLGIAVYLHMVPEFAVFTVIFMLLRTYAGGVHLNSFQACFICSVVVQTLTLLINSKHKFAITNAWLIMLVGAILILKAAPVESISRELESDEKKHCKKVTMKILIGIFIFAGCCTIVGADDIVSLVALTVLIILFSQYAGVAKYKIEKSKEKRE